MSVSVTLWHWHNECHIKAYRYASNQPFKYTFLPEFTLNIMLLLFLCCLTFLSVFSDFDDACLTLQVYSKEGREGRG